MDGVLENLDHFLFAALPYLAAVTFLVLVVARRYRVPPFGPPPPPLPGSPPPVAARLLFGYGLLVILAGHVLAFLIPEQILLWNNDPVRLYVLEVSALVFALMTLMGLVLLVGRGRIGPSDWILYALLLLQVVSGILLALFYPWGSSWYATSAVPYLRSVILLDPDLSYISTLPHVFKLHLATAYVLLGFLPFTRLVRPLVARPGDEAPEQGRRSLTTVILLVGLTFSLLALAPRLQSSHLSGNDQGYEPVQPIAFSHRLHAGEMEMSCLYCHSQAEKSRHAGIPAANVCMNCHRLVTASLRDVRAEFERSRKENRPPRPVVSAELKKLYAALGLDNNLKAVPGRPPKPIRWVKVHNLPAFVRFDHRAHVHAGVDCRHCHGPVETMEQVRQVETLSMGWCVDCHREVNRTWVAGKKVRASNDCSACHY
jgi:nitrate reductase gamma subunit